LRVSKPEQESEIKMLARLLEAEGDAILALLLASGYGWKA
jgi:hypothetical protein